MKYFKWFAFTLFLLLLVGISAIQGVRVAAGPWPEAPAKPVRLKPLLPPLATTDVTSSNGYYFLDQMLSMNNILKVYRRANAAPLFQMPFEPSGTIIPLHNFIDQVHLLRAHLMILAQDENWETFEADMNDSLILAGKLRRGGTVFSHSISSSYQAVLLEAVATVSERPKTPARVHAAIERMYEQLENDRVPFSEALRYEHIIVTNRVAKVYQGGFGSLEWETALDHSRGLWRAFGSTPQATGQHLDVMASIMIDLFESPYDPKRCAEFDDFVKEVEGWKKFGSDPVGRVMVYRTAPSITGYLDGRNRSLVAERSNRIINAMHGYKKREGKWPAKLKDLVPKDLAAVPLDPFDAAGAPMRYVPASRIAAPIVYSIGPDQKDDGGGTGYKPMGIEADLGRAADWFEHQRKKP